MHPKQMLKLMPNHNYFTLKCSLTWPIYTSIYEGSSNMNASSFITFVTYMLRQNGIRFYRGLYVTFKLAPDLKKNTVNLLSYSPLDEDPFCILTKSMLRTYQWYRRTYNSSINRWNCLIFNEVSPYTCIMILWKLRKSDMFLLNYNESFSLKSPYVCK